ncbi:MAG: hypothetical protein ACLFSE_10485 [Spirochaetia bacterium]
MKHHYKQITASADSAAENHLKKQIHSLGDFNDGGFYTPDIGLVHPGNTCGAFMHYTQVYLNPDSAYYSSREVLDGMSAALGHMERTQRPDGTWDLLTTNFYSSPDNGFIMHNLGKAYRLLEQFGNEKTEAAKKRLYDIIVKASEGMETGGFHTPNHRWVITAGLLLSHGITGRDSFKEAALKYLAEGIDCDEYGEFTEKSSGVYNTVNDNALIIISEETGDDSYLDHVKRNLDMMISYIDPDGSIFTQNSTRQDKGAGAKKYFPTGYYHLYLLMALKRNLPEYAWMADSIFRDCLKRGNAPNVLALYMLHPALKSFEPEMKPMNTDYRSFFPVSGIYRERRGDMSLTVLRDNSEFLFMQVDDLLCSMKLCASFFAVAQFRGETLEQTSDSLVLKFRAFGGYRLPLDPPPESPDWSSMDHTRRGIAKKLELAFTVTVTPKRDGADIRIVSEGCDRVPVKAEITFSPGGVVQGDSFVTEAQAGNHVTVRKGDVRVLHGGAGISAGPAFGEHYFDDDMRGSEPPVPGRFTVYFTTFTNMDRTVELRKVKGEWKW